MSPLESIDPQTLGQRISEARKARGLTQKEVADHLECSRPTYIAIEKGQRQATPDEIRKIASLLGRRVHELVRGGEPVAGLQPHLRAVAGRMKDQEGQLLLAGIDQLQRLAEDYRELEQITGAPLQHNYPPVLEVYGALDPVQRAESVAIQERQRLGLGDQPVKNLRSILEWDVGLRIFYGELPPKFAGMYAYTPDLGCCILINRKHPPERRRASLLHEYGHLIVDRYRPGIDYLSHTGRKPWNERFAESFALSFLMPTSSVCRRFQDVVATTGDFQVADLCRLSHFYFVSVEAMALRLEQLKLTPAGSWQALKESGLAPRQAQAILELTPPPASNEPYPQRYKYLAVQAFEAEKISQGQLCRFLRCDPLEARRIVAECRAGTVMEENGVARQLELPFERSLLTEP